jgi:CO/xanthine dehydrogenase FAD-binding subunit
MDVVLALTLDEALEAMSEHLDPHPIAGGTDLMVAMNRGRERPGTIVDLTRIDDLTGWSRSGREQLGAGVTYARIEADADPDDALLQAARAVGSPQIRARGTVGGNIGTASPAGDLLPVLAARDADIELVSTSGRRSVPWYAFFTGPKRTALEPGELIAGASWASHSGASVFAKVGPRNAMVISICSVCVQLDDEAREVRVAMGSVGPTVLRAPEAEAFAQAEVDDAGAWDDPSRPPRAAALRRFGELAAEAARPIDDVRGTAAYRRHAVSVLASRLLERAIALRPGA